MVKFCPSCGSKLEREYNFCPSCGFDLRNLTEKEGTDDRQQESYKEKEDVLRCDNCGEENSVENKICDYCGAPLKGSRVGKVVKEKKEAGDKNRETQKKSLRQKTPVPQQKRAPGSKELDRKKLMMIVGGVLAVIFIILWASGVFNSSVPFQVTQNQVSEQNSGVDLANIQKINELEARVKNNPGDMASLLELAHLKNDSGLYEQAIVNYQKYLEKNPTDADARIDMGVCYYNLRNYDEAVKQMETAIKYSPKHQIGYLNLGIVNLTAGNLEKSKEWLRKAIEIDPNSEVGKRAQELLDSHNK